MLRILSGKLKGRKIPYMKGGTHRPSKNKLREALFSILSSGDFAHEGLDGSNFLDLFSGTGAIGFEAISRGAAHVTLIDLEYDSIEFTKKIAKEFGIDQDMSFLRANAISLPIASKIYNIVFIDPPYKNATKELVEKILKQLWQKHWVDGNTRIIFELYRTNDISNENLTFQSSESGTEYRFSIDQTKLYGNSKLVIASFEQITDL